jgi:hypothetical protein
MPGNAEGRLPGEERAASNKNQYPAGISASLTLPNAADTANEAADKDAAWWRSAQSALQTLIDSEVEFTAATLVQLVDPPPRGRSVVALFSAASRRKQITAVGAVIGRTGLMRVWVGAR